MSNEVAGVGGLEETLLARRHEGGRDGIADHLILKLDALVALLQRLHVPYDATILPLSACNQRDQQRLSDAKTSVRCEWLDGNGSIYLDGQ